MEMDKATLLNRLKEAGWDNMPLMNTGNPDEFTILELANKVLSMIPGSKSKIIFEKLPHDDPKQRKPDITTAKKVLGWYPNITLDQGLRNTIEYFKNISEKSQ